MDLKEAVRQNLHVVGPGQKAAIQVCHPVLEYGAIFMLGGYLADESLRKEVEQYNGLNPDNKMVSQNDINVFLRDWPDLQNAKVNAEIQK